MPRSLLAAALLALVACGGKVVVDTAASGSAGSGATAGPGGGGGAGGGPPAGCIYDENLCENTPTGCAIVMACDYLCTTVSYKSVGTPCGQKDGVCVVGGGEVICSTDPYY